MSLEIQKSRTEMLTIAVPRRHRTKYTWKLTISYVRSLPKGPYSAVIPALRCQKTTARCQNPRCAAKILECAAKVPKSRVTRAAKKTLRAAKVLDGRDRALPKVLCAMSSVGTHILDDFALPKAHDGALPKGPRALPKGPCNGR